MPAEWKTIVANVPLVSVDLVIEYDGGVLLGKRENEPAKDEWFVLSWTVLKNESRIDAIHRVADGSDSTTSYGYTAIRLLEGRQLTHIIRLDSIALPTRRFSDFEGHTLPVPYQDLNALEGRVDLLDPMVDCHLFPA